MLEQAKKFLMEAAEQDGQTRMLAAVSGGLDSMCLLHLLSTWGRETGLIVTAAHFNHRLRGENADRDEAFVRDWCAAHKVPFVSGSGDTRDLARKEHLTIEEAARKLRYAFLERTATEQGCHWILTAHHADDNAETMLLNLLRGTGTAGLAGIPKIRGRIARPFRNVTREELAKYARENHIPYVEDETNETGDASRNIIRHQVLPVLREINPRAVENMVRTAEILAGEDAVLTETAEKIVVRARLGSGHAAIAWAELTDAPPAVRARVVLRLMETVCGHIRDLTAAHADEVLKLIHTPQETAVASLPYGMRARSLERDLLIERIPESPDAAPVAVNQPVRFGSWTVELTEIPGTGYTYAVKRSAAEGLAVTAWRSGDRLTLPGGRGGRTLKRLCADAGISPAERDLLPVLRAGERPVAVPGIGMTKEFTPGLGEKKLFVTFIKEAEESNYEE